MVALHTVASSLMIALAVQCSLAIDGVDTEATCVGDAACALEVSMLQLHSNEVSDEGHAEVVQLIHQASDCAGQATAFVQNWGKAWSNFTELLLPQNSMLSQLISTLTPILTKGREEALTSMEIAQRTEPPCSTSLQLSNSSMLLEATRALSKGSSKQLEELRDNVAEIRSTADQLAKLVSVALLKPLMCPAFADFIDNFDKKTIRALEQHIEGLKSPVAEEGGSGSLLQVEGTTAAMAQSLRLTESTCKEELSAFHGYAKDMVQYCEAMRSCNTALYMWPGLDNASNLCIHVFSQYSMNSEMRVCK